MIKQHNRKPLRIGVIGLGYWGPNLVRVLSGLPGCKVTALCDLNINRLKDYCDKFPSAFGTTDVSKVLTQDAVDAVVIATPTKTHYQLAHQALSQGIHTFVEKPLATSTAECQSLIELADAQRLKLFVGHVFLHSAPVAKLKEMVLNDDFGEIYYMSSTRLNLGPVRHDVSALWDLAPHDISIMLDLMGSAPVAVNCSGLAYLNKSIHDVCTLNMQFENNRMGIVHVSWLDPHKKREMTVVGSKKMAIYNDLEPLEKIKVYDNGVEYENAANPTGDTYADFQVSYRYGDMYCPRIVEVEPLKAELSNFVKCIIENITPRTDGHNGLDVVRVIEAADVSLMKNLGDVELTPLTQSNGHAELAKSKQQMAPVYVHPAAIVESDTVGAGTRVWAFAHVMSGACVGKDCNVGDHAFVESGASVGNNVTIKNHVCIWEGVTIEDDVFLGPHVVFTNDLYPRSPRMDVVTEKYTRRENWLVRTVAQRGCSIGANATILPGIRLGRFCMIAAGSTVTRDVKPHALMMGSPARQVGVVCCCGVKIENHAAPNCSQCGTLVADFVALAK